MKVRLGYACVTETLEHVTSSSSYTYTSFQKESNFEKLDQVIQSNFQDLEKIIHYNIKNNIHFYRLSSKIIPLATKEDVVFDYLDKYQDYYSRIGSIIRKNKMRVDFHPDQFTVLNSVKEEVVQKSVTELEYHYQILNYLGIQDKVLILHVGSNAFGKQNSITRFVHNFYKLPKYLQESIVIENDDKIFTIEDCLEINKKTGISVVLDYHHFICNHQEDDIDLFLSQIFSTWKITPKIHFSYPKNQTKKDFRSHHDYINSDSFIQFLDKIKKYNCDVDIMIEAKKKDEALFRLIRELKYKTDYIFLDETTFIV